MPRTRADDQELIEGNTTAGDTGEEQPGTTGYGSSDQPGEESRQQQDAANSGEVNQSGPIMPPVGSLVGAGHDQTAQTPQPVPTVRRRRKASGPRARQAVRVVCMFDLKDGQGNAITVPPGAKLICVSVSRDLMAIADRVLNHEEVGLWAKVEVPAPASNKVDS
jgi:hypothetical protein